MPKIVIDSPHLDANEAIFFERQLEYIKSQIYKIDYPEYRIKTLVPVDSSAGPGAEYVVYQQYDRVGQMKITASYADDAPFSDVKGEEFVSPVRSLRGAYGYSVQDVRNAAFANRPLNTMKAQAARESYEQTVNDIGWFADGSSTYGKLTGLLYNPNIPKSPAPTGTWSGATPDQIIADINFAIIKPRVTTKRVEMVNTVIMPVQQFADIGSTPRSATSDTTILEFVQRQWRGVTFTDANEVAALDPAPSGGAAPTDIILAYRRDPTRLQLQIPQPFEQFAPEPRNLAWVVNTHARIGNVIIYKPLSLHIVEGI